MISFEEAFQIVMRAAVPLGEEKVTLSNSLGRVLAEDVVADMEMPPFDKAMVDGYACRRQDLEAPLPIVETIAAGSVPQKTLGPHQCSKIMTGAMIPQGADCVFMVEQSEETNEGAVRFTGARTGDNISLRGSDVLKGVVLQQAGAPVRPQDVAVLASMGYAEVRVAKRPVVAVIGTGDELVEPHQQPGDGQIRNSNSYQLCAQIEEAGAVPAYHGIARDTRKSIEATLEAALAESNVILFSGGVSMGEFDLVPGVLEENGFDIQFEKMAIKPGKPTVFARKGQHYCFGLPGNPVSGFVVFELLVKPFLYRLMGHDYSPRIVTMPLAEAVTRRGANRASWTPVVVTDEGKVAKVNYHGSAHINALCAAHGLMFMPVGVLSLPKGEQVDVRLL